MITVSNPWTPKRYEPDGVREASRRYFDTAMNTYRFFALYANVEGWTPGERGPDAGRRTLLDRWLLSRLGRTVERVGRELERYQLTPAFRAVADFVNEDLSNWYVRRSRPRFWGNTDPADADAAFRTLWDALVTVARLTAPVTPLFSDWVHRALAEDASVHLARFPAPEDAALDDALEREMASVRTLVSLGRAAREEVRIRVRQPLRRLHALLPAGVSLRSGLVDLLKDELNVKEVVFADSAGELVELRARPDYRTLGPRFRGESGAVAARILALGQPELRALGRGEEVRIPAGGERVPIEADWLEVSEVAGRRPRDPVRRRASRRPRPCARRRSPDGGNGARARQPDPAAPEGGRIRDHGPDPPRRRGVACGRGPRSPASRGSSPGRRSRWACRRSTTRPPYEASTVDEIDGARVRVAIRRARGDGRRPEVHRRRRR